MKRKIPPATEYFVYDNANPKDRTACDCVVRAISVVTGKTWETVFTELIPYCLKYKVMPNEPACYGKYLEDNGYAKMPQPRKDDNTKYTGKEFIRMLRSSGNTQPVLAHIGGHHMTAIKDGRIHDIWDCGNGTIGNYWIKD